jgi:capsular polysaccharide biosynthesis protein
MDTQSKAKTAPVSKHPAWVVPGRRPNPLDSVRRHRWFVLLIVLAILAIGIPTALIFGRHEYWAEATLEISPTFLRSAYGGSSAFSSDDQYRGFVQQQVAEIGSYATSSAALDQLGKDRRLWQRRGESDRMAAERLAKAIDVNPVTNTYLISVSLTGDKPEGPAQIVNAVVKAYLQRQRRQEIDESNQRVQLLTMHRDDLQKEADSLRAQESAMAQELGISSFGANFVSPFDKLVDNANTAVDIARRATIKAQAHLDALNADEQRRKALEVDSTAEQMVAADPEVTAAEGQLTKQREDVFLELQQLGPNHPGRPALQQEMQRIDAELARMKSGGMNRVRAMLVQNHQTKAQQELSAAQAQLDQAQLTQKGIEQQFDDLRGRASSFSSKYKVAVAIDSKLSGDNTQIQQIDEQIGVLQAETQSPGFVSIESAAMTPDVAIKGTKKKIGALFLLAAMILAVGLPTGLDMIDPLIKTPDELEAIVGFPPFGTALSNESRIRREALRRIALAIIRECRLSETRGFVFTPVSEGPASRTLAFAVADEIKEFGVRALAIESKDLVHESIRAGNQVHHAPLTQYLADGTGTSLSSAPLVSGDKTWSHAPIGRRTGSLAPRGSATDKVPRTANRRTAALPDALVPTLRQSSGAGDGQRTAEATDLTVTLPPKRDQDPMLMPEPVRCFLDNQGSSYDVVLFSAPPILTSADAEMLMQMPTGAILVVRSGHDVPRDVVKAVRRLERLAPPVVGTVITYEPAAEGGENNSPQAIVERWIAAR